MGLARGVARRLGLPPDEREIIARAAELHDIGKMAIPDAILSKPGPLDDREWRFMRRHTIIGEDILNAAPALQPVAALVRASHERWDGTGYPDGTAGEEIPEGARIVAVCDAFSAMVQERPYQPGLTVSEAVAEIERCAGEHFDPARRRGVRRRDPLRSRARVRRVLAPRSSRSRSSCRRRRAQLPLRATSWSPTRAAGSAAPAACCASRAVALPCCWPAGAPLSDPWAVAVMADGALLVVDEGAEAVFSIAPAGTSARSPAAAGCRIPSASRWRRTARPMSPTGSVTRCCGSTSRRAP